MNDGEGDGRMIPAARGGLEIPMETGLEAVRLGAEVLASGGGMDIRASADHDEKIEADLLVEKEIMGFLRRRSPYPVLSEEDFETGGWKEGPGMRWILDPIDGTINFRRGIPLCCISLALWNGTSPVLGIVQDFGRKELFTGIVGVGARMNGAPIAVSAVGRVGESILMTGFPSKGDFSTPALGEFIQGVRDHRKVRLLGSAALSLAYVAAGRADAYREKGIMLWDVAAGLAIVKAAGGAYRMERGFREFAMDVSASNGRLEDLEWERGQRPHAETGNVERA